jgi:hypothetical protein
MSSNYFFFGESLIDYWGLVLRKDVRQSFNCYYFIHHLIVRLVAGIPQRPDRPPSAHLLCALLLWLHLVCAVPEEGLLPAPVLIGWGF